MENKIKCGVEECKFQQSMACNADAIEVRSSGDRKVNSAEGTACNTFQNR